MENIITKKEVIEKQAVFSKDMKKRYELTISLQEKKGKSILVLCLNPASDSIQVSDTTTNYLMNHLFLWDIAQLQSVIFFLSFVVSCQQVAFVSIVTITLNI